jgi:hypothetical protein
MILNLSSVFACGGGSSNGRLPAKHSTADDLQVIWSGEYDVEGYHLADLRAVQPQYGHVSDSDRRQRFVQVCGECFRHDHGNAEQHDQCGDLNRGRKRQDGFGQYHGHAAESATTAPTDITPLHGEVYYVLNQLSGLEANLNNNSTTGGDHLVQQQQNSTNLSQRWAFTKLDQP